MMGIYGEEDFKFLPKTYVLPQDFQSLSDSIQKDPTQWWIVKPAASS
jgi:hypothetical protein